MWRIELQQHLQRDRTAKLNVIALPNLAHAAVPEPRVQPVSPGEVVSYPHDLPLLPSTASAALVIVPVGRSGEQGSGFMEGDGEPA